ncbi:MAG: hypothetical protein JO322_00705 [Candidatus Eremiobacteraeota bacterium]|nr:hypothetical protein [Candidatus Eremiobacteraeota bacterium]
MLPQTLHLGENDGKPHVAIEVTGFEHPDTVEPHGMDLLTCTVHAVAPPVDAAFDVSMRVEEFSELRSYLAQINSGNGPAGTFSFAGGLFELSFAPSRRGPVLCAVRLKSIESSHVRVEYMVTLEPENISRALMDLSALLSATSTQ